MRFHEMAILNFDSQLHIDIFYGFIPCLFLSFTNIRLMTRVVFLLWSARVFFTNFRRLKCFAVSM